jgi:hypothetical protein
MTGSQARLFGQATYAARSRTNFLNSPAPNFLPGYTHSVRPTRTCFAPVTYSRRDKPAAAAATSSLTPTPSRRQNASAV